MSKKTSNKKANKERKVELTTALRKLEDGVLDMFTSDKYKFSRGVVRPFVKSIIIIHSKFPIYNKPNNFFKFFIQIKEIVHTVV